MPICMSCDREDVPVKTFVDDVGDLWLCEPCADDYTGVEWDDGEHWYAAIERVDA